MLLEICCQKPSNIRIRVGKLTLSGPEETGTNTQKCTSENGEARVGGQVRADVEDISEGSWDNDIMTDDVVDGATDEGEDGESDSESGVRIVLSSGIGLTGSTLYNKEESFFVNI